VASTGRLRVMQRSSTHVSTGCGHLPQADPQTFAAQLRALGPDGARRRARLWITRTAGPRYATVSGMSSASPYEFSPAARVLWRSPRVIQVELGTRAVVIDGVDATLAGALGLHQQLGSPDPRDADEPADPGDGTPRETRADIVAGLGALRAAGLIWPRSIDPTDDLRSTIPRPRLRAELTALTARHGERAAEVLSARRHSTVIVHGTSRVAAHLGALLAAAGVGRVHVVADRQAADTRLTHAVPGGIAPRDEGTRFGAAAAEAIGTAAPECDVGPLHPGERPDLVVLAVDEPVDPVQRSGLHARDWAHLAIALGIESGIVGPLVIPGLTSCLRCADLHRADRDPAWPALAVQLGVTPRYGTASSVAVATLIAGVAALQALDFLDGGRPATVDGTIELHLPDWQLRRRSWPVHPDCDCMRAG
jgi:hypothetical protein